MLSLARAWFVATTPGRVSATVLLLGEQESFTLRSRSICSVTFRLHRQCSSYANANVEQLKALLFNYREQTTRFKNIKTRQDVGLVRIESGKLEGKLRPSPQR